MSHVVDRTKENLKKCKCLSCPSYSLTCKIKEMPHNIMAMVKDGLEKTEHLEGMFCAYEKSECIEEKQGCSCPECALRKEYELDHNYFCLSTGGI